MSLTNAPEAEAQCGKRHACPKSTNVFFLAQLVLWSLIPEAPADALQVVDARQAGGSNRTILYRFDRERPPTVRAESWMRHIVLSLSRQDPNLRPSAHQLLLFVSHCERHSSPSLLSPALRDSPFAPFGYLVDSTRPSTVLRMTTRREMLVREITRDGDHLGMAPHIVDWGSNEGYFSLSLMAALPQSTVYSVDPNIKYFGAKPADSHREHMVKLMPAEAHRSIQCISQLSLTAITCLGEPAHATEQPAFDYQLALSVFHWLPIPSRSQFLNVLGNFLRLARTTFIELPEAGHKTSANFQVYRHWYSKGENLEDVLWAALDAVADTAMYDVRYLGDATIDFGKNDIRTTTRQMYRVDLIQRSNHASISSNCSRFAQCVACKAVSARRGVDVCSTANAVQT